jgi:hypothetical protein
MTNIKKIQSRIEKVFKELEKQKIIGEQEFWCCQTCGASAMEDFEDKYDGYVFYHSQDFDSLKSEGYTYLSFGSFRDVYILDIAHKIVKAFQDEGIKVNWNGDINTRIMVDFNDYFNPKLEKVLTDNSVEV